MSAHVDLDQIADALEAGEVPPGLAAAFRKIAEGEKADIALGLARHPGQRKLTTVIRQERRDNLLGEVAAKYFPSESKSQQAKKIAEGLSRYRASAWSAGECNATECPHRRIGRREESFWRILKARDRDLAATTIYRVLLNLS